MEKTKRGALASMALAGLCTALWLYIALFRWQEDRLLALAAAGMWLVVCVTWGLRAWKANNNHKEEET